MDHGSLLQILALLGAALVVAKVGAGLAEKVGIPGVLVELLTGIAVGNIGGTLGGAYHAVETSSVVSALSEMGVLFLLFLVGLETNIREIGKVGLDATTAAVYGVVAPFLLAFLVIPFFFDFSFTHTLFLGAALTATSVGITARVLQDCGKLRSVSGQVILGAAVIDDILGVIILTVVAAIVSSGTVSALALVTLILKVAAFGLLVVLMRRFVLPRSFVLFKHWETGGSVTAILLALCLISAWVAKLIGLEGIIGAFALGIALDDTFFKGFRATAKHGLEELIKPVVDFFAPIFFIYMGMGVKWETLANPEAMGMGALLILIGVAGKMVCGLGLRKVSVKRGGDRLLVGFGMIPRGEVGLIFAAIGQQIGVLTKGDYSAIVLMVVVTTLVAPFLISWRAKQLAS